MRIVRVAAVIAASCLAAAAQAAEVDDLVGLLTAPLAKNFVNDWREIEKLRGLRWAPLPPKMLEHCLPDGGCFTRSALAEVGGRKLTLVVSGARTMTGNFYFRNTGAPFGEQAVLTALKRAGYTSELKRCPVPGSAGSQNWYRLSSARSHGGHLAIQTSCKGQPCEGFAVLPGNELPPLQPNQLKMYSEQCAGSADERKPVSTVLPHEQLAATLVALLPPPGPPGFDWKTLTDLPLGIQWHADGAKKGNLSFKNDPHPWMHQGQANYSGRSFTVFVGGTPARSLSVYLDENDSHPRGEDVLALLRAKGLAVQLVRCGPVYTESINNWYRISGTNKASAMLRQSLSFDGKRVSDSYALRFDATLPPRDPRDRDPGVAGCK